MVKKRKDTQTERQIYRDYLLEKTKEEKVKQDVFSGKVTEGLFDGIECPATPQEQFEDLSQEKENRKRKKKEAKDKNTIEEIDRFIAIELKKDSDKMNKKTKRKRRRRVKTVKVIVLDDGDRDGTQRDKKILEEDPSLIEFSDNEEEEKE